MFYSPPFQIKKMLYFQDPVHVKLKIVEITQS